LIIRATRTSRLRRKKRYSRSETNVEGACTEKKAQRGPTCPKQFVREKRKTPGRKRKDRNVGHELEKKQQSPGPAVGGQVIIVVEKAPQKMGENRAAGKTGSILPKGEDVSPKKSRGQSGRKGTPKSKVGNKGGGHTPF